MTDEDELDNPDAWRLVKPLKAQLKAGNIQTPREFLLAKMREARPNPFGIVVEREFTNDPREIAEIFDDFVEKCCETENIRFIYTETNGFAINPNEWFFDPFGFSDLGTLASEDFGEFDYYSENHAITLTGMEDLQEVYASKTGEYPYEWDLAGFIIVSKFHQLISRSVPMMRRCDLPVFADGHDWDFVARVNGM